MSEVNVASEAYRGDIFNEDPSVERVVTPLWRESLCWLEWTQLRLSPVYWGAGVPRGAGRPVLLVPGFLASDVSLTELWGWLVRMGYRPYFSDVGSNIDCPDATAQELVATLRRAHEETGETVSLVGHSLGGMLARSIALDHPQHVRRIIALGSPFRDHVRAHPAVLAAAHVIRESGPANPATANVRATCFTGHCTCNFVKNLLQPGQFQVPRFAIYSRTDGVVDWESCVEDDPRHNIEVAATHTGMVFNAEVYRVLGQLLADGDC